MNRRNCEFALKQKRNYVFNNLMRSGAVEYVWSDMLSQEVLDNPFVYRRDKILEWKNNAAIDVEITPEVIASAEELVGLGLGNADALHLACARTVDCDWFITADAGILKKVRQFGVTRVANPVEFVVEEENED